MLGEFNMEINTVKCGKNEDVIIEYHLENKAYGDVNITVDMLKTSPVGTKWRCGDNIMNIMDDDVAFCVHSWELVYRDGYFGALIKHTRIRANFPLIYVGDIVMDIREYIWYEF